MAKRKKTRALEALSKEQLLELRLCDLDIRLQGNRIWTWINKLQKELQEAGFAFRPHFWLGEEFFCPQGVPGIAIPFYLAHPVLENLEKEHMFEAEGSDEANAMKILRHECGHAIENAYRLQRKKLRIKLFGRSSQKYPELYVPKRSSRSFVINLGNHYAQSHPDEDFAETFAVWLRPDFDWRKKYLRWPARKKLLYIDQLMSEIAVSSPLIRNKKRIEALKSNKKTLRQYYEEKKIRFGLHKDQEFNHRDIKKVFSNHTEYAGNKSAVKFIRSVRKEVRQRVSYWTGQYRYLVDEVIKEIYEHCKTEQMRIKFDEENTKQEFILLVTTRSLNYLHEGGYKIAL